MITGYRYTIPFSKPFQTGSDELTERQGVILHLQKEGISALGEAAPLPGFSSETTGEVAIQLSKQREALAGLFRDKVDTSLIETTGGVRWLPSVRFAIDTLIADFVAQRTERTAGEVLFEETADRLAVNAVLPAGEPDLLLDTAREKWELGYRTFKMKAGIDFTREYRLLEALRQQFPSAALRVDANRSWDLGEAVNHLQSLADFDLEYCEEPLSNPTSESLRILERDTSIPVALDETLYRNPELVHADRPSGKLRYLIVKPMVLGGFTKIFETIRGADTHDYTPVFTSSLESGIGRIMTATLASGLCDGKRAHGLATGSLLKMDVWNDRAYIDNGYFYLPDHHGLGKEYAPRLEYLTLEPIELDF